jgi:hypothetical protein
MALPSTTIAGAVAKAAAPAITIFTNRVITAITAAVAGYLLRVGAITVTRAIVAIAPLPFIATTVTAVITAVIIAVITAIGVATATAHTHAARTGHASCKKAGNGNCGEHGGSPSIVFQDTASSCDTWLLLQWENRNTFLMLPIVNLAPNYRPKQKQP